MPPHLHREKIEQIEKMILRWESKNKDVNSDDLRDMIRWHREHVDHKGFMVCTPAMEAECSQCANLRPIVEHRLIGKLSDKPWQPSAKPEPKPQPTPEEIRAKKQRRLERVESDLSRLQQEAEKLRGEIKDSEE
jgi:hypothetical protein